jgi:hypothetical protein
MLLSFLPIILVLPVEGNILSMWQTNLAFGGLMLGVLIELLFWRGPLGVITRSLKKDGKRNHLFLSLSVRILILRWSIALWQGLALGALDALLSKNGHKRWFS